MVNWKSVTLALLGSTTLGSVAMAQEAATSGERGFSIKGHFEVEHRTNVAGSNTAEALSRGITPEDTLYTPSLQVDYNMPVGRQSLFVSARGGRTYYDANKKLDSDHLNFNAGIRGRVGPCATVLQGDFNRGRNLLDNFLTAQTARNVLDSTTAGLEVTCARATGLGVDLGLEHVRAINSLKSIPLNDYESDTARFAVQYQRPAFGTLSLLSSYTKVNFLNSDPLTQSDGYEAKAVGVSYVRRFGARIQGTVSTGYTQAEPVSPPPGVVAQKFDGWTYSADISFRPTSRLTTSARFDKAITPSGYGQSFQVTTGTEFSATYKLGSRIQVTVGDSDQIQNLAGGLSTSVIGLTHSRMNTVSGDISYRQSQRLGFTLRAAHDRRKTNDNRFDYDADRVALGVDVAL